MNWPTIIEEKKYCILKLEAHNNVNHSPLKPYTTTQTKIVQGTGFIVDIDNGLVLTASSLVHNNIVVRGTNDIDPSRTIRLNLFCINDKYGFAICQMREEDKDYLQARVDDPSKLDIIAKCCLAQAVGQQVLVLGYPETTIQAQISKWSSHRDTYRRLNLTPDKNYIGAPVFNSDGNCLGLVIKHETKYDCLLFHTIVNIYPLLTTVGIVNNFDLGLSWSRTSEDFTARYSNANTVNQVINGVYINKLYPGTLFTECNHGDILMSFTYSDHIINQVGKLSDLISLLNPTENVEPSKDGSDNSSVTPSSPVANSHGNQIGMAAGSSREVNVGQEIIGMIDNMGDIDLYYKHGDNIGDRVVNHKIVLDDILRLMAYDKSFSVIVCRDGNLREINVPIVRQPIFRMEYQQLQYQPCNYEIIAGMCITPLTMNHTQALECRHLDHFVQGDNRFIPRLIVTHIYANSTLYDVNVFAPGDIILQINGRTVQTIEQLQQLLNMQPSGLEFVNHKDKQYYISRERAVQEDRNILQTENIRGYSYVLG